MIGGAQPKMVSVAIAQAIGGYDLTTRPLWLRHGLRLPGAAGRVVGSRDGLWQLAA